MRIPTLPLVGEAKPRKSIAEPQPSEAKADRKPLAVRSWKEQLGLAINRALELAGLTKQEVSYAMGYPDQSALSRWIAGTERPQFDKLFAIDGLRHALVVSLAQLAGDGVAIETVIRIERKTA